MPRLVVWSGSGTPNIRKAIGDAIYHSRVKAVEWSNVDKIPKLKKGDVCLAMGGDVLAKLQAADLVHKGRTITSLRGKPVLNVAETANFLITYNPTIINIDTTKIPALEWDVVLATRMVKTGSINPILGKYRWVDDFSKAVAYCKKQYKKHGYAVPISIDLETVGLDAWAEGVFIVSIFVTYKDGTADGIRFKSMDDQPVKWYGTQVKDGFKYIIQNKKLIKQIRWLLGSKYVKVRGANFKYDERWLSSHWDIQNFDSFKMDTLLVGSLLDENRANSLNVHTKQMVPELGGYDDELNANYDKGRMDLIPDEDLLPYAGGDTDACLQVSENLLDDLNDDPILRNFYTKLVHPASQAFRIIEQRGMVVDVVAYEKLRGVVGGEITRLHKEICGFLPPKIKIKYRDNLKITRDVILREFLFTKKGLKLKPKMFTEKKGDPSTSMEHLDMLSADHEEVRVFVDLMREYNSATKTMSTYITGFMKHLRSDGRFHPSYVLHRGEYGGKDAGTVCVTASTLFTTTRGVIPVLDIVLGDNILTHKGVWKPVTDIIDNGIKDTIKVTLSSGHTLTTTYNHPYYTSEGWVHASDLKVDTTCVVYGESEVWKRVEGWPYKISNWGRVKSVKSNRILRLYSKGNWGHLKVVLCRGDRIRPENRKDMPVHRLVALAFVPNVNDDPEVRHIDGRAGNNYAHNLCWGTSKDNTQDAMIHGTTSKVETSQAKLDWDKVAWIRSFHYLKGQDALLAEQLGVSRELVRDVRLHKRWEYKEESEPYIHKFKFATVVSIEFLSEDQTYGITVEDDHSHVTNGIVTHNTGRSSCKDPAYQCCTGSSLVITKDTETVTLEYIVTQYEKGQAFKVLTHTGEWKPVVGVYRNGVRPLLRITTKTGAVLDCTHNHPWLTDLGFMRAEYLTIGAKVWRHYEESDGICGRRGISLDCVEGSGDYKRTSEVPVPVQLRDDTGITRFRYSWQEAEQVLWLLQEGQAYNSWSHTQRESICNLLELAAHDYEVLQPGEQGLFQLWREGYWCVFFLARFIREFSSRYGGEACRQVIGQIGREWQLSSAKLQMGHALGAGEEPEKFGVAHLRGSEKARKRLGKRVWVESGNFTDTIKTRVEPDSSPYHACQAEKAGFVVDEIVSVEEVPAEETFDLTIEDSHSFIANGVVVHNTIPKHTKWAKPLRKVYVPPPGHAILNVDYSQGELRIAACVANETTMLKSYRAGIDMHLVTGAKANGMTLEDVLKLKAKAVKKNDDALFARIKEIRQGGKAGNFGLLYGMGAEGFRNYARNTYGVYMSLEEATEFRTGFFEMYTGLVDYHREYKRLAHKNEYIRSPLGRLRHLPLINSSDQSLRAKSERMAINSPIQATLSDLGLLAAAKLQRQYPQLWIYGFTHDALSAYVPIDDIELWARRMKEVMENLPLRKEFGWQHQLPFIVDVELGMDNMADSVELKMVA